MVGGAHAPLSGQSLRPGKAEIAAARNKKLADVIAPGLRLLFVGINPSLYSAAVGCHFARPGNRFWPTLHRAGFTDRRLVPAEQGELLRRGCGITNLVARATAAADELSAAELCQGARTLRRKVGRYRPAFVAFLGVTSYRAAFQRPHAGVGLQPEGLGPSAVWLLPNPSGLNAHYQLPDLARLFADLHRAAFTGAV